MNPTTIQTITLSDDTVDQSDIVAFANWLSQIYGSPDRSLVNHIRSTAEYRLWRQRVEWCHNCQRFVPADPLLRHTPDKPPRYQLRDHESRHKDRAKCAGSQRITVYTGDTQLSQNPLRRRYTMKLLAAAQPTGETQ